MHQLGELGRLSVSMKKLEKDLKKGEKYKVGHNALSLTNPFAFLLLPPSCWQKYLPFLTPTSVQNEQYCANFQQSNERSLALIKAAMDVVVAVGLLQLAPKKVTPRVTGAFGFVTSLITCYQVTVKSVPSS